MSRRVFIAAVLLVAGTVVNVAVAWGCYLRADPDQAITLILDRDIALWKKYAGPGWPAQLNQVTHGRAFGFETRSCSASGPDQVLDSGIPMGIGTGSFDWHWPGNTATRRASSATHANVYAIASVALVALGG